jgi:hypothetical protein
METMMIVLMAVLSLVCVVSSIVAYMYARKASYGQPTTGIVMPVDQAWALVKTEKIAKGQTVAAATKTIQSNMPGWKVVVFSTDDKSFYSKHDAWDMTKSYPDSVVILASKGVVHSLIYGPTGGRGIECGEECNVTNESTKENR